MRSTPPRGRLQRLRGVFKVSIAVFNYYIAVARDESFRRRFTEMAGVSLGVAIFSFVIGYIIRQWLGVEV